jgi:hypothetical protein
MNALLENNFPSPKLSTGIIQLIKERSNFPVCHSSLQFCPVDSHCSLIHAETSMYEEIGCISSQIFKCGPAIFQCVPGNMFHFQ